MHPTPCNDWIVVRRNKPEEQKVGIIITPNQVPTHWEGEVLSVGPGRLTSNGLRVPPAVAVGAIVAFPPHRGFEMAIGGERYDLITEGELLAIVTK